MQKLCQEKKTVQEQLLLLITCVYVLCAEKKSHPYGHGPCLGNFTMDSSLRRGKFNRVRFMEYFSIHFFNILHSGTLREKGRTHSMDEFSMGPPESTESPSQ